MREKIKNKWQRKQEHFAKKKGKVQRRIKKVGKIKLKSPKELQGAKRTIVDDYFSNFIKSL